MQNEYKSFRDKVFSALHTLAKENSIYEDARMLVGSSEAEATLVKQDVLKTIDTEWLEKIEEYLPYLDTVIRNPSVAIQDVEEILPVEISRHINDRSVKHLAQHTNLILDIKDDGEVVPQKILNVYRDETYHTYENKFVNTLLARLVAFVDKRYTVLADGMGTEKKYKLDYQTEFEHQDQNGAKNTARITFGIELTSPLSAEKSASDIEINENYKSSLERIIRIRKALMAYQSSSFAQKLGRAYIRPPVIRTNAILKNKNMKECLKLWEYIESFDKTGYSVQNGASAEMPASDYISDLYSTVALQYVNFYNGVTENEEGRILSDKHLFENDPQFSPTVNEEELEGYMVYDSEYKKLVPVSRLMNTRAKLSKDEHKIAEAIAVALEADKLIEQNRRKAELERQRAEEAERKAEEAKRKAEEKERIKQEAEEKRRLEAEERKRIREAERARAKAEKERILEEERIAKAKAEAERIAALIEEEKRRAEEARIARLAEVFYPEDRDLTGRAPLCPYTKKQYSSFGRKKKKQTKIYMEKVADYRAMQKLLEAEPEKELAERLIRDCEDIRCELSMLEGWLRILELHGRDE